MDTAKDQIELAKRLKEVADAIPAAAAGGAQNEE
jgi:hypothetical protein